MGAHICCVKYVFDLYKWFNRTVSGLRFGVPMVWRDQRDHSTD